MIGVDSLNVTSMLVNNISGEIQENIEQIKTEAWEMRLPKIIESYTKFVLPKEPPHYHE